MAGERSNWIKRIGIAVCSTIFIALLMGTVDLVTDVWGIKRDVDSQINALDRIEIKVNRIICFIKPGDFSCDSNKR